MTCGKMLPRSHSCDIVILFPTFCFKMELWRPKLEKKACHKIIIINVIGL